MANNKAMVSMYAPQTTANFNEQIREPKNVYVARDLSKGKNRVQ